MLHELSDLLSQDQQKRAWKA